MKALILVGGFGTRLRPLTFSCPKPLVEFANYPIVEHQIAVLSKVGIKEIILAVGFQPTALIEPIKKFEEKYNVKITCSQETEPLGTAGPLRLAKDLIRKDNEDELVFVFNSDIISEYHLQKLIDAHKTKGGEGTIYLTKVQDPSKYGVVVTDENNQIKRFVEKPKEYISDRINAGLYIFSTKVLDRIPMRPSMLEKDIFPKMAEDGVLYALDLDSFWMDVGQPKVFYQVSSNLQQDFITGTQLILESYAKNKNQKLAEGDNIIGNVLIHPDAKIDPNAIIGPNVTIDAGCIVETGVRLKNVCLMKGVHIKSHAWINESIIGWNSSVGKWVRIEGITVLGEDVHIKDELFVNGSSVLPHKTVNESLIEKGTIIM